MIKSLYEVRNVGRFVNEKYPDLEFARVNLIFAENGCGKTTFAEILHSLGKGEPGYMLERATVDSTGDPQVGIYADSKQAYFNDGEWHGSIDDMRVKVYDERFVNENIYSGYILQHEHKKKLHQFIIGSEGREKSNRIERIDRISRQISQRINQIEENIESLIESRSLTIEGFINLEEKDNIDDKIESAQDRIKSTEELEEIQKKDVLEKIDFPDVSFEKIKRILKRDIEKISSDVENRVASHLNRKTSGANEKWLERGVEYIEDSKCPFCGQSVEDIEIVSIYKKYFGDEYERIKKDIQDIENEIKNKKLRKNGWMEVVNSVDKNESISEYWEEKLDSSIEINNEIKSLIKREWKNIRKNITSKIDNKKENLLENTYDRREVEKLKKRFKGIQNSIRKYNTKVESVNERIGQFKLDLGDTDKSKAQAKLDTLKDIKKRYSKKGKRLAQNLSVYRKLYKSINKEKKELKDDLSEYQEGILRKTEKGINVFLRKANAPFKIDDAETSYMGGSANTQYSIVVNERKIEIGNAVTEVGKQGFRNVLSEGDKNTLAFAFFIARLQNDSNVPDSSVVIDDPISSLDEHRRRATSRAVCDIIESANQVFVLSHSPTFLGRVWDHIKRDYDPSFFEIKKTGQKTSELTPSSSNELNRKRQSKYFDRVDKLFAYADRREGKPSEVGKLIRPVLEGYLRRRFPKEYGREEKSIGKFVGLVEQADPRSPLSKLQDTEYLDEIREINEYCTDQHHDRDPLKPERINKDELEGYVKRALDVVRAV